MRAYVNIGSNLGDRAAHIERAVAAIEAFAESSVARSAVVESAPWGYESCNGYLNVGVAFDTDMEPLALLDALLGIQCGIDSASHRDAAGQYVDRVIDIDLIAVDELMMRSERLTLPHPRMHEREFVLRPLAELAPHWRHPANGMTAEEMLAGLKNRMGS